MVSGPAPGGTGAAKCGGNYAASLASQAEGIEHGCDQVVFLDATEHRYVEELGGMNLFFVYADGRVVTPELTGTILAGVTRSSLVELARERGLDPHGGQHMRGLYFSGRTGGPGRHRDPVEIERDHGGFGLDARNGEKCGVGKPLGLHTENDRIGRDRRELRLEPIPQSAHPAGFRETLIERKA